MVYVYEIKNPEKRTKAELSEPVLLDCIRLAKQRNRKLYDRLVDCWEQLHQKTFDDDRELQY